jgi:hypothetical protein
MAISLSTSFAPSQAVAAPSDSSPAEVAVKPVSTQTDTVKLSQAAHIHLLKQQGQAASQIASNLGLSVSVVDGYLGVAAPKAASTPTAPAVSSTPSSAAATAATPAKG